MAETGSKNRKRKWHSVVLDDPAFFSGDMEGFVSLEVLEDYELEETQLPIPKKKLKPQSNKVRYIGIFV